MTIPGRNFQSLEKQTPPPPPRANPDLRKARLRLCGYEKELRRQQKEEDPGM